MATRVVSIGSGVWPSRTRVIQLWRVPRLSLFVFLVGTRGAVERTRGSRGHRAGCGWDSMGSFFGAMNRSRVPFFLFFPFFLPSRRRAFGLQYSDNKEKKGKFERLARVQLACSGWRGPF